MDIQQRRDVPGTPLLTMRASTAASVGLTSSPLDLNASLDSKRVPWQHTRSR